MKSKKKVLKAFEKDYRLKGMDQEADIIIGKKGMFESWFNIKPTKKR